ncbi:EAL domain-containing protein, partial [Chromobacterium subtsugae]|uniref:EAL domain-containing protein n=1 Tax=Chromobacterium subtsugae TaxID=251747 RepID=UPI000B0F2431
RLSGLLTPAEGARHDRLIEAMRQGPVVGFYFPCLLEYSVPAAIEQLETLPAPFLLAGGYDSCAAFIGSPDLLLRKAGYPPLLWLSGLEAERDGVGYHFEAYGYDLTFNRRVHNGVRLMHEIGAMVVVEGIETERDVLVAMDSGCDLIQGYFIAHPAEQPTSDEIITPKLDERWDELMAHALLKRKLTRRQIELARQCFVQSAISLMQG